MKKILNKANILGAVVSGDGQITKRRPDLYVGNAKHGYLKGDLMDANAVSEIIEEAVEHHGIDVQELHDYIDLSIDELVDGAPEALDTLKELSEALQDNPDSINYILTTLDGKQDEIDWAYVEIPEPDPGNDRNKGIITKPLSLNILYPSDNGFQDTAIAISKASVDILDPGISTDEVKDPGFNVHTFTDFGDNVHVAGDLEGDQYISANDLEAHRTFMVGDNAVFISTVADEDGNDDGNQARVNVYGDMTVEGGDVYFEQDLECGGIFASSLSLQLSLLYYNEGFEIQTDADGLAYYGTRREDDGTRKYFKLNTSPKSISFIEKKENGEWLRGGTVDVDNIDTGNLVVSSKYSSKPENNNVTISPHTIDIKLTDDSGTYVSDLIYINPQLISMTGKRSANASRELAGSISAANAIFTGINATYINASSGFTYLGLKTNDLILTSGGTISPTELALKVGMLGDEDRWLLTHKSNLNRPRYVYGPSPVIFGAPNYENSMPVTKIFPNGGGLRVDFDSGNTGVDIHAPNGNAMLSTLTYNGLSACVKVESNKNGVYFGSVLDSSGLDFRRSVNQSSITQYGVEYMNIGGIFLTVKNASCGGTSRNHNFLYINSNGLDTGSVTCLGDGLLSLGNGVVILTDNIKRTDDGESYYTGPALLLQGPSDGIRLYSAYKETGASTAIPTVYIGPTRISGPNIDGLLTISSIQTTNFSWLIGPNSFYVNTVDGSNIDLTSQAFNSNVPFRYGEGTTHDDEILVSGRGSITKAELRNSIITPTEQNTLANINTDLLNAMPAFYESIDEFYNNLYSVEDSTYPLVKTVVKKVIVIANNGSYFAVFKRDDLPRATVLKKFYSMQDGAQYEFNTTTMTFDAVVI